MKSICHILSFTSMLFALPAYAEWSAGGGELIKDSQNPWFIQNTNVATYCIVLDSGAVGISDSQADSTILDAITYWRSEFSYSDSFDPQIRVATQTFNRIQCNPEQEVWADITFQYGYLTTEQRDYIGNVRRYASLSVRTNYERESLRGKGFIYFAAESGPDSLSDPNLIENPWSRGDQDLLFWTTVHELGHVFGLPHNAERPEGQQIMSHRFVEHILTKNNADLFPRDLNPRQIFALRANRGNTPEMFCNTGSGTYLQVAKDFFGVNPSWKCLGTLLTRSGLEIWAAENFHSHYSRQKIGTIKEIDSFNLVKDATMFWLPPEQGVFPGATKVNSPAYRVRDVSGEYVLENGTVFRKLGFTLDPRKDSPLFDDLKIGGELHGRFYSNIIEGK